MMEKLGRGNLERFSRRTVFFFFAFAILIFYVSPIYKIGLPYLPHAVWLVPHPEYLVYTFTCKISDMNPFDNSVLKYIKKGKLQRCDKPFVLSSNKMLMMNERLVSNSKYKDIRCCFRDVTRVTQKSSDYNDQADWQFTASKNCTEIPPNPYEKVAMTSEFVQIECKTLKSDDKTKPALDFYAAAWPPEQKESASTRMKAKYWEDKAQGSELVSSPSVASSNSNLPPSVLILGIDSISRLHMLRSLPETRKFLVDNDFVEMKGYTKIGENTFPNMMGALGGMPLRAYPCWKGGKQKMDDCPLIWKNFSSANYLTAFLEDSPTLAIFNYLKTGFVQQPTDYYLRTIATAYTKKLKNSRCIGGLSQTTMMLKYMQDFVLEMKDKFPFFLFSWFTSIAHDDFNGLKPADGNFKEVLSNSVKHVGNNTIILFISDHGYRFGNFRETFLGYYEESLPFFYIRLPPNMKSTQFIETHGNWYKNLKDNSYRLTSPLDLHATLEDILSLSSPPNFTFTHSNRHPGYRPVYSFFEETPQNRTCETSDIPQMFCRCGVTPAIGKKSKMSSKFGDIVIKNVNAFIEAEIKANACVPLKFKSFLYGREVNEGEVWNNFGKLMTYKDYLIALEASPSSAHFEATIRYFKNETFSIIGNISRINSYGSQADCIKTNAVLKNYCMCVEALEKRRLEEQKKKTLEAKKKQAAIAAAKKKKKTSKSTTLFATTTTTLKTSQITTTTTAVPTNTRQSLSLLDATKSQTLFVSTSPLSPVSVPS